MAQSRDTKRLEELGESEYRELKDVYCKLRDLKEAIARMHDAYVAQGAPPDFTVVEGIQLQMEEVFDDLERYLLPECDPDSAVEAL